MDLVYLVNFFFGFDPRDEFHPPFGEIFFWNFFFQVLKSRKSKMIGGGVLGVGEVLGLSFFFQKNHEDGFGEVLLFFWCSSVCWDRFFEFFFGGGLD